MNALISLVAVLAIMLVAYFGVEVLDMKILFGVVLPYAAIATFLTGFVYRIVKWAKAPVPFRIPTTCGQQKSLPWIKHQSVENPSGTKGVIIRMALEILCFRSLFRNTKTELHEGPQVVYSPSIWLWAGALAFHYCFLVIVIRHLRFFLEPVPGFLTLLQSLDGFWEIGVPPVLMSGLIMVAAASFLLARRIQSPQLRYISLPADYLALFLILAIGISGLLLRHFVRIDVYGVKELVMGLVTFHPKTPEGVHWFFYMHLTLVAALLAFFPFSKLMHLGGVFLSPTRNMANNNRAQRHINPWNAPVKVHTYEEYEDDFREKMKNVGLPVDKE